MLAPLWPSCGLVWGLTWQKTNLAKEKKNIFLLVWLPKLAYYGVEVLVLHSVQKLRGAEGFWASMCPHTSATLRPWIAPLADHFYFTSLPVCKGGQFSRPKKLPRMAGCGSICLCSPEGKGALYDTVDPLKKGLRSRHWGTGEASEVPSPCDSSARHGHLTKTVTGLGELACATQAHGPHQTSPRRGTFQGPS